MRTMSDAIKRLNVQDSTGGLVVYVEGKGYLLRKIDGWRKESPEFVEYAEVGIGLSPKDAEEQKLFLGWEKIHAQVKVRKRAKLNI